MKILVDMNLSPASVPYLGSAGIAATRWSSIGAAYASDPTIFAHAKAAGLIVLTHDLDFGAILAVAGGDKPSVVQIRAADVSPSAIGAEIVAALKQMSHELEMGALLTVDPGKTRLRLLPLQIRR
jgi:predicted nuclease of predicted toxin-antitoxin system